ncbi:MAG: UDP-N-acetylglucosamine 2-epimerase [Gemmatimonadaceae bacterium]
MRLVRAAHRTRSYTVATIHRAENTTDMDRLRAIVSAFANVSQSIRVVWPVHPRTRAAALSRSGATFIDSISIK